MKLIIDCLKNEESQWTPATTKAFKEVKRLMSEVLVMHLPDLAKMSELTCDTSRLEIGGVLNQENYPIAYFSEKLNDA